MCGRFTQSYTWREAIKRRGARSQSSIGIMASFTRKAGSKQSISVGPMLRQKRPRPDGEALRIFVQ